MPALHIEDAVELIQMEYVEMPGLKLTFWQARRLFDFSEELCERALAVLIRSGFLARTSDGAYLRRSSSSTSAERIASLVRAMESDGSVVLESA